LDKKDKEIDLIKVFSVRDSIPLKEVRAYEGLCEYYLFDTLGRERGGTGIQFNWESLDQYDLPTPFFLSGGIGPDDAESLIRFFKTPSARACHAVDVNSRFEDAPGLKNIENLKKFIDDIKELRP
jgi:phosphoribosylanthranilate isomerase